MEAPSNTPISPLSEDAPMNRTLLIGDESISWKDWLKTHGAGRDLICLDPVDPMQAPPGRFTLHRGDKLAAWRFYGSLDPIRAPHVALASLAYLVKQAGEDTVIQFPSFRPGPLMRQFVQLAIELIQPQEILLKKGLGIDQQGFPVGPTEITLEHAFPEVVRYAQRKALWIKLIEDSEDHEIELDKVTLEGTRLGSGQRMGKMPIEALHMEICGSTLLIVADKHPEDRDLARALDASHCSRVHIVEAPSYNGLLCSFARQNGEDFGMGMIKEIDFVEGLIKVRCTAVAPAPVRILRIGGLQLDMAGNEIGELKPWQV